MADKILNVIKAPSSIIEYLEEYRVEVKEGDTLTKIAREEGTTAESLVAMNPHLTQSSGGERRDGEGNWIYPGDTVVILRKKEPILSTQDKNTLRNRYFSDTPMKEKRLGSFWRVKK